MLAPVLLGCGSESVARAEGSLTLGGLDNSDLRGTVQEVPGVWSQINQNEFLDIATTRDEHDELVLAGSQPFWGNAGPIATLANWGGGAFDTDTGTMYFNGGGHFSYGGNEVYSFNFQTGLWARLNAPSSLSGPEMTPNDCCENPGPLVGPHSVHSYDGLTWHGGMRQLYTLEVATGFVLYGNGKQPSRSASWSYDPATAKWTRHAENGQAFSLSAYNSIEQEIWATGDITNVGIIVNNRGQVSRVKVSGKYRKWGLGAMDYDPLRNVMYGQFQGKALFELRKTAAGSFEIVVKELLPVQVKERIGGRGIGVAVRKGIVWLWGGTGALATFDPATNVWRLTEASNGRDEISQIYGKFDYWPDRDRFVGVLGDGTAWTFEPGTNTGSQIDPNVPRARIGATKYQTMQAAFDAAIDGDTIILLPGEYASGATITANNLTIIADGVHIKKGTVGGKATFVIRGNNTTIRGLEVSEVNVPSGNGAAIRMEGTNLTLHNVHFHDSQQGVLGGGGEIRITDSKFERLGFGGQAHGIYINKRSSALIIEDSQFLAGTGEGHEIKTRAARNIIRRTVVDSKDGVDSLLLDAANGGVLIIEDSILVEGPNSSNRQMIGYGLDATCCGDFHIGDQRIEITNTELIKEPLNEPTKNMDTVFLRVGQRADPSGNVLKPHILLKDNQFSNVSPRIEYR